MQLTIGWENEELLAAARALSRRLNLVLDNQSAQQIVVTGEGLFLKIDPFLPLHADFRSSFWQKRRDEGKKQALIRACKPALGLRIIDATAGWGRDSALLAIFGAQVLMLERNPVMAVLLEDALNRQDEHSQSVLQLSVRNEDAMNYLNALSGSEFPDVIYIDPMHPIRQKSALVKKDLQVLQQLIGPDQDVLALLQLARKRALKRVVVKWPQNLPSLLPPTASIPGKTVRFDIYGQQFNAN